MPLSSFISFSALPDSQRRLLDARVMVVGCGALGNEVLKNLALLGVGNIFCVDFDLVESSNLNRSVLFRHDDAAASRPKVDAIAHHLLDLNPALHVTPLFADIAFDVGLALIASMDVVVSCVDSRWARFMINRHCHRTSRPWVDGGIFGLDGTARLFRPDTNCYACSLDAVGRADIRRRVSCSGTIRRLERDGSAPTTPIVASVIGAVQAQEAVKVILGYDNLCGRLFYYDGDTLNVRIAHFHAFDPDCPEHDHWSPVIPSNLTPDISLSHLLAYASSLDADALVLRDDCFVDSLALRSSNDTFPLLLPGRRVQSYVENHPLLSRHLLSHFYQHEYRSIDASFPYLSLTLRQLGIPDHDILRLRSPHGFRYLSLSI